jgi:mutator protein MutT
MSPDKSPESLPHEWMGVSDEIAHRLVEMAREFRASGKEPAVPRSAATVVLLRPDRSVFLIRRLRGMAFGGMWAFPGGALEPGETPVDAAGRELQEETGVVVSSDSLVPWHRWLTPVFEPKRFDTWFFLTGLPPLQEPTLPEAEASHMQWITLEEALTQHQDGSLPMLPPTLITLTELSTYDSVEAMLSVTRDVSEPFTPEF